MILGNLNVQLNSNLAIRITEHGDVLDAALMLAASNQSIEIGDIIVEIIKPVGYETQFINYTHTNKISTAKNFINNNSVKWLGLRILHKGQENQIKKLIDEYKYRIYQYANENKFVFGSDKNLEDLSINKQFFEIKDDYKAKILNNLFLTQGNYNLIFNISHRELQGLLSSNKYKSIYKQSSFNVKELTHSFEIELDNFLGQIMSNILFAPDRPIVLKEPALQVELA